MQSLHELLNINGVLAVYEFAPDGKCTDFRSKAEMSPQAAQKATQYVATVTMMFNTLASAFTDVSQMNWVPQRGWTYTGGDWMVAVGANRAVFAEADKVDVDELRKALGVELEEQPIQPSM